MVCGGLWLFVVVDGGLCRYYFLHWYILFMFFLIVITDISKRIDGTRARRYQKTYNVMTPVHTNYTPM